MTAEVSDRDSLAPAGRRPTEPDREERVAPRRPRGHRVRRLPDWLVAVAVGVVVAGLGVIPQWRGSFFYYVGDGVEQFVPLWHVLGEQLRAGRWPTMDPAGWVGGNLAAEAMTGLWNPVNLLDYLLVSTFDNLSLAAFAVSVQFLGTLGAGVYLLAREYGSARVPATVVATAVPVSGFTLWYEAAGWPIGLMAFTWVTHFWWSTRRHARGALNPLVPFVFGYLAVTTGNPYGTLGVAVVAAAVGLELLLRRRFGRLLNVVLMAACVGSVTAMVFLPLLGVGDVSDRQELAEIANDTFLVPDLGDLAASSSPSHVPSMLNWSGAVVEHVPSTYSAWFLLPLLPWLRWDRLVRRRGSLISLWVVLGWYALASLGPSNLWLFRWPVRLIEYLYLAVAVCFAVVLSAGLSGDRLRRRAIATVGVLLAGCYLSWAVRPADVGLTHVTGLALAGAATGAALWAYHRSGMRAFGAAVLAGSAAVLFFQSTVFPVTEGPAARPPYDLAAMSAGTSDYRGTVLQLSALDGVSGEEMRDGRILFGNLPRAVRPETVTSYSGIGFRDFQDALCMDYRGAVCPAAFDRLWEPAGDGVPVPLVDAMRVSTLVVQRSLRPDVADLLPPTGWSRVERSESRTVWVRDRPLEGDGRVAWSSVQVTADSATAQEEVVRYRADSPGDVLLARLAWPGYRSEVDGRPVTPETGPAGLLRLALPAGEHTLVVTHAPPGLALGRLIALGAVGVVVLQSVLWWRQRRRGTLHDLDSEPWRESPDGGASCPPVHAR